MEGCGAGNGAYRPVTSKRISELAEKINEVEGVLSNNPGLVRHATAEEKCAHPGKEWVILRGNTHSVVLPI